MNTARRSLPYVRQYVIVAIYEVLEQLCAPYEKTDAEGYGHLLYLFEK